MPRSTNLACVLLLIIAAVAPARAAPTAVTVVDFYNLSQSTKWEWLSRGIADLLITDLSTVDDFRIVDRESLRRYLDEMQLQDSGLLNNETLIDVGKIAGVDKVVFGTFEINARNDIIVNATVVDINTQSAVASVKVSGPVAKVLDLQKDLSGNLIRKLGVTLSDRERKDLAFAWTASLDEPESP